MMEIVNIKGDSAEVLLHGIVGRDINGVEIAHKLKALKDLGVKHVKERINSPGGSIQNGYSIVAANLDLTANGIIVETLNEGVSDSMASVILASGTKGHRKSKDYARSLIHNPIYGTTSLNDIKDESIKEILQSFKDSLIAIYASALNKTPEEISDQMDAEKMLNPDEMLNIGLIDEIEKTNIDIKITENISLAEIMNMQEDLINNKTQKKMEKVNEFYNLSKDASEDSLLIAAKAERKERDDALVKASDLQKELDEKSQELSKYKDEAIKTAVSAAIESGKFDENDKESLIENCTAIGLDAFNLMVGKMKVPHVNALKEIEKKSGEDKEKVFEDYSSSDLEELKIKSPEKYEALVNEFNERD